jgi:hypothetical protein
MMKKTKVMLATFLLLVTSVAWGEEANPTENSLTASDVTIVAGQTAELHIGVINQMNVAEYSFRLYLPEGISVQEDEYGYFYEFTDRHPKGRNNVELFTMTIMDTDEQGVLMFSAACPSQKILNGNEGDAQIITLRASDEVESGNYVGRLGRIDLSNEDGSVVSTPDDVTFIISVKNVTTDISDVKTTGIPAIRYNTKGQRVNGKHRGLVIEQGRKIIVK